VPNPTPTFPFLPPPVPRRLVLGVAIFLALAVTLVPRTPAVHAQEARPAAPAAVPAAPKAPAGPSATITGSDGKGKTATINITTDDRSVKIEATAPKDDAEAKADADSEDVILGVRPRKGKKGVRVGTFGDNREYDSFNDFVHNEPAIAFMIVGIVAIVFLSPVLAIALILWYRMRKNRMLNETMLKLAEKGVVPPAEALGALAGNPSSVAAAVPATAPIYEQAKQIRRRAAWSDLRKGVIMGGIGLGLTLYSMFDDRSANGLGLVLLFVGAGYIVLWWFEERQLAVRANGAGVAPSAPPSGGPSAGA
jgi:hypothetical protein